MDENKLFSSVSAGKSITDVKACGGGRLGAAVEGGEGNQPRPLLYGCKTAGIARCTPVFTTSDTPVAPGEETLSVTVSVSWAIKPKQQ